MIAFTILSLLPQLAQAELIRIESDKNFKKPDIECSQVYTSGPKILSIKLGTKPNELNGATASMKSKISSAWGDGDLYEDKGKIAKVTEGCEFTFTTDEEEFTFFEIEPGFAFKKTAAGRYLHPKDELEKGTDYYDCEYSESVTKLLQKCTPDQFKKWRKKLKLGVNP